MLVLLDGRASLASAGGCGAATSVLSHFVGAPLTTLDARSSLTDNDFALTQHNEDTKMINRENLERVKTILAQVPQGRFDLDQWNNLDEVDYNGPIELDTELKGEGCGFIGCVIGWAALDPFFNKQGLLTDDFGGAMRFVREDGVNVFADEFVPHLFGIPAGVACALIGVDPGVGVSYSAWTRFFYGSYNWNAPSETDVIRAIDWVLANETLLKGEPPEGTLYPEA